MVNFNFGLGDNKKSDDATATKNDGDDATTPVKTDDATAPTPGEEKTTQKSESKIPNPFADTPTSETEEQKPTETPAEKTESPKPKTAPKIPNPFATDTVPAPTETTQKTPEVKTENVTGNSFATDESTKSEEKKDIPISEPKKGEAKNPFATDSASTPKPEKETPTVKKEEVLKNPFATDEPPKTEEKPEVEKNNTDTENPFGVPASEDTTVDMKIPEVTKEEIAPEPEPIIPATKEKPAPVVEKKEEIQLESKTNSPAPVAEKKVPEVTAVPDLPKPEAPKTAAPVVPVFEPEPAEKSEKEIEVNKQPEKKTVPPASVEPTGEPKKEEPTPTPVTKTKPAPIVEDVDEDFGDDNYGDDDTTTDDADPLATLSQVKKEIEEYVQSHKAKIKSYQTQITDLQKKIDEEKKALRNKQSEFAKMIDEMKNLTTHFGTTNGDKPRNNNQKIIRHKNGR